MKKFLIPVSGIVVISALAFSVLVANAGKSYTLTTQLLGTGSGLVASSPSGINCPSICSASFNRSTVVTLTATADGVSSFTSWSGCDSTSGNTCTVTMSSNKTVSATFTHLPTHLLTVQVNGTGNGNVQSNPFGILCPGIACSANFVSSSTVELTAMANATTSSVFAGWTGCDTASGTVCDVIMSSDRTVTATFN